MNFITHSYIKTLDVVDMAELCLPFSGIFNVIFNSQLAFS